MHPDECVDDVEKITRVVDEIPGDGKDILKFPEDTSTNDKNQIVKHCAVDQA